MTKSMVKIGGILLILAVALCMIWYMFAGNSAVASPGAVLVRCETNDTETALPEMEETRDCFLLQEEEISV